MWTIINLRNDREMVGQDIKKQETTAQLSVNFHQHSVTAIFHRGFNFVSTHKKKEYGYTKI